ncbi:threonine/serine exporter family protein [Clostridium massiliamazoniense]|uniref:threonine/serine exporter family protein n=1 Tax=Clostridium massiliamazoniense TaxID=1347366 RepID=UPI0006D82097|nr:threonine/serine exporter family protein [Clostridium massiliamazoniense]
MDIDSIVHVATLAGKIILESGGETYRVEETIVRICHSFGISQADSYVTPTGIMVSVCHDKNTKTLIKRVKSRGNNLQKIHLVNNLSRELYVKEYTVTEFEEKLNEINSIPAYPFKINVLCAGIAAASFAIPFGGTFKDFIAAFFIGMIIKVFVIYAEKLSLNSFFINSIGGAIAAVLAIISSQLGISSNVNNVIIGSIMLLVPGMIITNAIRDTISGDLVSGLTKAAEAILIAVSIAVGTGMVMNIWINHLGG